MILGLSGKSTNLYTYALNNPLVFRDPEGKVIPLAIIGAGAIIGAVTNAAIYSVVTHGNNYYVYENILFTVLAILFIAACNRKYGGTK